MPAQVFDRERRALTIGILLAAGYFTFVYRSFAGKVVVGKDHHEY